MIGGPAAGGAVGRRVTGLRPAGQGGRGVAGRWRIRHKLMLGLGLVVGVLALLLAGTLKGLASYRATTRSMDSKIDELKEAQLLKVILTDLAAPPAPGVTPWEEKDD